MPDSRDRARRAPVSRRHRRQASTAVDARPAGPRAARRQREAHRAEHTWPAMLAYGEPERPKPHHPAHRSTNMTSTTASPTRNPSLQYSRRRARARPPPGRAADPDHGRAVEDRLPRRRGGENGDAGALSQRRQHRADGPQPADRPRAASAHANRQLVRLPTFDTEAEYLTQ